MLREVGGSDLNLDWKSELPGDDQQKWERAVADFHEKLGIDFLEGLAGCQELQVDFFETIWFPGHPDKFAEEEDLFA